MASFRRPKGVHVRPAKDWYYRSMATGVGEIDHGLPADWNFVALYNNDTAGRSLFLDQFCVFHDSSFFGYLLDAPGKVGTFQRSCTPVSPDFPLPPGQMFTGQGPAAPAGDVVYGFVIGDFSGGPIVYPSLIVPPDHSLIWTGNPGGLSQIMFVTVTYRVGNLD